MVCLSVLKQVSQYFDTVVVFLFVFLFFKMGSHYVPLTDLELAI